MDSSRNGKSSTEASTVNTQEKLDFRRYEIDPRGYFQIIIKRKKIIIALFLVVVIITAITSRLAPRVYRASALINVVPTNPQNSFLSEPFTSYLETADVPARVHRILLKSNKVLEKLVEKLKSKGIADENLSIENLSQRLQIIIVDDTNKKLNAAEKEKINILSLSSTDTNPEIAKDIVNLWADAYIQYRSDVLKSGVESIADFVIGQFDFIKKNVVEAEQVYQSLDANNPGLVIDILIKEKQNQLISHSAKFQQLSFAIKEKKALLGAVNDDIASMTQDGVWLGAFGISELGENFFADKSLTVNQTALRQKVIKAKFDLENCLKKQNNFINNSKITLLKAEVAQKRANVVKDETLLSQIRQLNELTKTNLYSKTNFDMLKNIQSPMPESLSEMAIWEILSLAKGYNFFETSQQSIASKLEQEQTNLKDMEMNLFEYEGRLKTLDESLASAQANYDFFQNLSQGLQGQKRTMESEIVKMEQNISYSSEIMEKLPHEIEVLKEESNKIAMKFTEQKRQLDIYKASYETISSKIEDARMAKKVEFGDIKIISKAFKPQSALSRGTKEKMVMGGIVGLVIGVLAAFFLEFWQEGKFKLLNKTKR